jgi:hypothetical protein
MRLDIHVRVRRMSALVAVRRLSAAATGGRRGRPPSDRRKGWPSGERRAVLQGRSTEADGCPVRRRPSTLYDGNFSVLDYVFASLIAVT